MRESSHRYWLSLACQSKAPDARAAEWRRLLRWMDLHDGLVFDLSPFIPSLARGWDMSGRNKASVESDASEDSGGHHGIRESD